MTNEKFDLLLGNMTLGQYSLYEIIRNWIDQQNEIIYICIGLLTALLLISLIILWNQRKIKKQLRQLLEEKAKNEDKP